MEDNIRIDLREIGWEGVDWIHLAQDTDQWRAVVTVSFSQRSRLCGDCYVTYLEN